MKRRISLDDHPVIVIWEVTRCCALACCHCRAKAQLGRHPLELKGTEVERLLDQIAETAPKFFVLTGGDPITRPDLRWIAEQATARGLRVALSPSVTPSFLRADFTELRQAGIGRMSLSLDGASKHSHDAFRGIEGIWDWTMQAIHLVRSFGIEVQINTTFSKINIAEWEEFTHLLASIKPSLWSIFLLVPIGRAKRKEMPDSEETEELFLKLARFAQRCGFPVKTTAGPHYRRVVMQQGLGRKECSPWGIAPTNDGKGFVFISHTGDIQPSGFLPITCGNVRQDHLLSVYRNAPLFQALRDPDHLHGKCKQCEFRGICGGSRARAFAVHGDCFADDPCCVYQPESGMALESTATVNSL